MSGHYVQVVAMATMFKEGESHYKYKERIFCKLTDYSLFQNSGPLVFWALNKTYLLNS